MKNKWFKLLFGFLAVVVGLSAKEEVSAANSGISENALASSDRVNGEVFEEAIKTEGTCGANTKWVLSDEDGDGVYETVTISKIDEGNPDGALDSQGNSYWWGSSLGYAEREKLKRVILKEGITEIYWLQEFESVEFPQNSLKIIGANCFNGGKLKGTLEIPDSVEVIGDYAFDCASGLTGELVIPSSVKEIGKGAFYGNGFRGKLVIPNGITRIEDETFEGNDFTEIVIPESVTYIGKEAFLNCSQMTGDLIIPDSVREIGDRAFYLCYLKGNLILSNQIESIGENAFNGCEFIGQLVLPKTVKSVAKGAFSNNDFYEVMIEDGFAGELYTGEETVYIDGVEYKMPTTVFQYCHKLEKIINYSSTEVVLPKQFVLNEGDLNGKKYACKSLWVNQDSLLGPYIDTIANGIAVNRFVSGDAQETEIPDGPDTWKDKTGTEGFVYRLYNVAMCREADELGFQDWNTKLQTKASTAAEVAQGFIFSEEFQNNNYSNIQYVKILYRTMFGREADEDGLNGWVSDLENGVSREYVYRGFAESQEFTNLCNAYGVERGQVSLSQYRDKNVGATGFIARLYTKMLGRSYDVDGLNDWCEKYLTGKRTIESIATEGFLHSQELKNQNLSDEEFVIRMYETFLNREPDEDGFRYWIDKLQSGEKSKDDLVYGFTLSQEFANIKADYGL